MKINRVVFQSVTNYFIQYCNKMYLKPVNLNKQTQKLTTMTTTMKLAIETYSNLANKTFEEVVTEINNGNKVVIDSVMMLMFTVA